MIKWLGSGAMVLGFLLVILGAQSMLHERRYSRAIADLNALLWGPSANQKLVPRGVGAICLPGQRPSRSGR